MGSATGAPAYVQVFPTLRCDRSCSFCFSRGLAPAADLPVERFAAVLDRLAAAGTAAVDLLGGEPTLHPRLEELVAVAAARRMRVTLSTNGTGRLERLERLEDRHGRDALRIGVSVNEDEVPAALAAYLERRAPMVKSLCARGRDLPAALREHLSRPGAEGYLIFRDALAPGDLEQTLAFPEFAGRLAALRGRFPALAGVACGGFLPDLEASPDLARARCPAGTTKLSVLPDGSAYPCYLLFGRPEFRLGNLATDPFEQVWRHPALEFFRTNRGNPCARAGCVHRDACHGGCPAVSLLAGGGLAAPDPRCAADAASGAAASPAGTLPRAPVSERS